MHILASAPKDHITKIIPIPYIIKISKSKVKQISLNCSHHTIPCSRYS
jgi:hypothetical protein